jgi:hypothetical protein
LRNDVAGAQVFIVASPQAPEGRSGYEFDHGKEVMALRIKRLVSMTMLVLAVLGGGVAHATLAATPLATVTASSASSASALSVGPLEEYLWS